MKDAKFCPICGGSEIVFSESGHYFKCSCSDKWMCIGLFEYREVVYIEQKLKVMRKAMLSVKETEA